MCATYKDKQKRQHFESFANKIFTGIREIKPDYAEKRAIWELFQNALDTVEKDGIIEIAKTNTGLLFRHNGRPFTDDEFGALIKQYSLGKAYGGNTEKIGQYGTGFISTHIYGKKIMINGSIKTDDGSYRLLDNFLLDRDAEELNILTDKLLDQDDLIERLCEDTALSQTIPLDVTTFEYQLEQHKQGHVDAMLSYIRTVLPYIFCFNDKLKEVKLSHDGTVEIYKSDGAKDGLLQLTINDESNNIPFLETENGAVKVILGSSKFCLDEVPKLFLNYPLMDTVETGINFLVHAKEFKPNKERDYLYKSKDNEELKADVLKNESLMKEAYGLVLGKVSSDYNLEAMDTLNILFVGSDSDFECTLKCDYISKVRTQEIIHVGSNKVRANALQYFDKAILALEEDNIKALYTVLCQFIDLPPLEQYCELALLVNNWNVHLEEKFKVLGLADIAGIIVDKSGGDYFYISNKEAYQKVIFQLSKDASLLNSFALIPNMHGRFKARGVLVKWEHREPCLIDVVDSVEATISEKYIHEDFELLDNINPYNRTVFKDDFSKFCNESVEEIGKGRVVASFGSTKYSMLIRLLTEFIGLNKKTQLNIDVAAFFERTYGLQPLTSKLDDPTVDVNYQPAIKLLAHLYILRLKNEGVLQHLSDLKEIVGAMFLNKNLKEELLHKLPCIPDQNLSLKSQTDLKADTVLDEDFKNQYDAITGGACRNDLAHISFGAFLQHSSTVGGEQLGAEIEIFLDKDRKFIPVNEDTVNTVIVLIEKISIKPVSWGQWLPNINKFKEEILMHKFQNGNTRSSLFSILTKDEKTIGLLGELAKVEDLADLINKGKQKQQEDKRKNNHLDYIKKIGTQIQDIIENQLGIELAGVVSLLASDEDTKLTTKEEQNGQDFIIYKNGNPIYFLEVKSKWDENGRFALSKNQTEKCALQKNEYAVISVNVDRYKKQHSVDTEDIQFEELKGFVKVNDDLGAYFEELVSENNKKIESTDPKLIEFRGSIPQKMIDIEGIDFDIFILKLIDFIKQT